MRTIAPPRQIFLFRRSRPKLLAMHRSILVLAVVVAIVAALAVPAAAQSAFADPNAPPAPFQPHMGTLMGMLIQPRHAKLGLAGQAENWPLAAYALRELKQGFAVVAKAVPRFRGQPVAELVDGAVSHPLTLLDFAIKLRYPAQFNEAYGQLTAGCNACHATTGHPFVVIKVPEAGVPGLSAFPDQDFVPK
jgi:hypothetical protein